MTSARLLDGTCSPSQRAEILAHVDGCADCQELLAGLVAMRTLPAEPPEPPPAM